MADKGWNNKTYLTLHNGEHTECIIQLGETAEPCEVTFACDSYQWAAA
jgi:hypothetical protein